MSAIQYCVKMPRCLLKALFPDAFNICNVPHPLVRNVRFAKLLPYGNGHLTSVPLYIQACVTAPSLTCGMQPKLAQGQPL